MSPPTCVTCELPPARGLLFCRACWTAIPTRARTELDKAWKATARHPTSPQVRALFDTALAHAAGWVR